LADQATVVSIDVGGDLVERLAVAPRRRRPPACSTMKLLTTDRADLAVGEHRLKRAVRLQSATERRRQHLVQISKSIWSTPSLRALFSKPCRVSSYP
jgi:hypothetical protein